MSGILSDEALFSYLRDTVENITHNLSKPSPANKQKQKKMMDFNGFLSYINAFDSLEKRIPNES